MEKRHRIDRLNRWLTFGANLGVVLTDYLDVPLYSADRQLVERFPHRARLLSE